MIWTMVTRQNPRQQLSLLLPTICIGLFIISWQTRSTQVLVQQPQPQSQHTSSSNTNGHNFWHQVALTTTALITASVIGDVDSGSILISCVIFSHDATKTTRTTVVVPLSIPKPPLLGVGWFLVLGILQ